MTVEIGFTEELTNSQYAPLAVLSAYYQQKNLLEPLARSELDSRVLAPNGSFAIC